MRKALCAILCICLLFIPIVGSAEETEMETGKAAVLAEAEYNGYKVSVLDYEYDEAWQSYTGASETSAICIRFYFENENDDPLYLLESFGIAAYQDGIELNYIGLNSDDEEAQNTITSVMDGAGLYCMVAFETTSDNDVKLRVTEPTAEANLLIELTLTKEESSEETYETDGVRYTVYTTENQIIVKFENTNDAVAFISKTNVTFYDESGEIIDVETMEAVFVDADSVNYGEVTYHEGYASVEVVPYVYEDDEGFDYNDGFETIESVDEDYPELHIIISNIGGKEASAMLTVVYYKDDEICYVAPDIGETWLYAGDSQEVTVDLPRDEDWNRLEYDSYEILIMGYSME